MLIYKHTGLSDYIYFISQHGLKGEFIIYERLEKENSYLHLPKPLIGLYNVDISFWKEIKTITL